MDLQYIIYRLGQLGLDHNKTVHIDPIKHQVCVGDSCYDYSCYTVSEGLIEALVFISTKLAEEKIKLDLKETIENHGKRKET